MEVTGAPGWLSQLSVRLLISAQVVISQFVSSSPRVGLFAEGVEPAWDSLSAPPHTLRSLSKKKKERKKEKKRKTTEVTLPSSLMAPLTCPRPSGPRPLQRPHALTQLHPCSPHRDWAELQNLYSENARGREGGRFPGLAAGVAPTQLLLRPSSCWGLC